jgi:hypothetical protein
MATLYPNEPSSTDIEMYEKFLNSYVHLLPCKTCRIHFSTNLEKFTIANFMEKNTQFSSSKNGVILWGIKMHNIVNRSIGKNISVTENKIGIDYLIKKYQHNQSIHIFKNVLMYSLKSVPKMNSQFEQAYSDLFYSVAHFLSNLKIDLIQILKKKNVTINFKEKNNIQTIISNL